MTDDSEVVLWLIGPGRGRLHSRRFIFRDQLARVLRVAHRAFGLEYELGSLILLLRSRQADGGVWSVFGSSVTGDSRATILPAE